VLLAVGQSEENLELRRAERHLLPGIESGHETSPFDSLYRITIYRTTI
jgi:hypothetical protein